MFGLVLTVSCFIRLLVLVRPPLLLHKDSGGPTRYDAMTLSKHAPTFPTNLLSPPSQCALLKLALVTVTTISPESFARYLPDYMASDTRKE